MITLRNTKTCSCCKAKINEVRSDMVVGIQEGFVWFNCACGSTLLVPEDSVTDEGPDSLSLNFVA